MNILAAFGEAVTPEVVTPSSAHTSALVRFRGDTGSALKADALQVLSIKVKPVETLEAANKLADDRAKVKLLLKNIEARRKQIVEPLNKEVSAVNAEAHVWADPLVKWDKDAQTVLLAWEKRDADARRMAQEARHKAITQLAEDQAAAEARGDAEEAQKASTAIMVAEATPEPEPVRGFKTDAGTTYKKTVWKVEVVDPLQVPDAYLVPDLKKLQAAVDGGARQIDGCNIFEQESLVVRTR